MMNNIDKYLNVTRRNKDDTDYNGTVEFYLSEAFMSSAELQTSDFDVDYTTPLDLPYKRIFLSSVGDALVVAKGRQGPVLTKVIYVEEVTPGLYMFSMLLYHVKEKQNVILRGDSSDLSEYISGKTKPSHNPYCIAYAYTNNILKRMAGSSVATGTRKVNAKTKIKGKKHKHYRPSDIIYVTRKGDKSAPTAQRLTITRWSEAWRVRGHWRKIKGLGKDRLGDRCVAGYTWVSDYVKGDGDAKVKKYVL